MVDPTQTDVTPGRDPRKTPLDEPLSDFLDAKAKTIGEDGDRSGTYVRDLKRGVGDWIDWMSGKRFEYLQDLSGRSMARWAEYLDRRAKQTGSDDAISPSTAWAYYDRVSAYLQYCTEWEYIAQNPAAAAVAKDAMPDRPAGGSSDTQFWSPEQRRTLCRYVDDRAAAAIDTDGLDAIAPVRDRALVFLLGYSGVRGSEVLKPPRGDDERRTGVTWADIDLEGRTIEILGKSQSVEQAPLTTRPVTHLERWEHVLKPSSEDWPVFPTLHLATLREAAGKQLEEQGVDADERDRVVGLKTAALLDAYREHDLRPPALTTAGARYLLKNLTEEAGVDVTDGPKDYLTLHGARRGVGEMYYREAGPSAAQRALRHADPSTTSEMYSHIEASELSDIGDEVFDE